MAHILSEALLGLDALIVAHEFSEGYTSSSLILNFSFASTKSRGKTCQPSFTVAVILCVGKIGIQSIFSPVFCMRSHNVSQKGRMLGIEHLAFSLCTERVTFQSPYGRLGVDFFLFMWAAACITQSSSCIGGAVARSSLLLSALLLRQRTSLCSSSKYTKQKLLIIL